MILTSDREFKETKLIRQGKQVLISPFGELAEWISARYQVNVLNVVYDPPNDLLKRPRLQIIVEHAEEEHKFRKGGFLGNYLKDKQDAISVKFTEILDREEIRRFQTTDLFIIFSAFAPLAMEDADGCVSDARIKQFKKDLNNPDLWEISRCFGKATFFFYTDAQAKGYDQSGLRREYSDRYFSLVKPHDEFEYIKRESYWVAFDSKENFDKNYESNWYYYYK
jgi:hypothetical protein